MTLAQLKKRRGGKRRGGAILEMALTLTLLTNLTFGMIEFGYYFYVKNMLDGAARVAVRTAITPSNLASSSWYTTVTSAASSALANCKFPSNSWTTTVTDTAGNTYTSSSAAPPSGTVLQVQVSGTWGTIGAGFRPLSLIGSSKTVAGLCVMECE